MTESYLLPETIPAQKLARSWLVLGVVSLALAGIFAILLVLARTPYFQAVVPYRDFFTTALIIHVNLSVLVWLTSMTHAMSCWLFTRTPFLAQVGYLCALAGTIIFAISPFLVEGEPLLNNYIPIINSTPFHIGITTFLIGMGFHVVAFLIEDIRDRVAGDHPQCLGLKVTLYCNAAVLMCFMTSWIRLQAAIAETVIGVPERMELLFWGGGHVLQMTYMQAMIVAWV